MRALAIIAIGLGVVPASALADRGALTLDGGAAGVATLLRAPAPAGFTTTAQVTPTAAPAAIAGARYAISNSLELTASALFQPTVSVFHNAVTLTSTADTPFPGTMVHGYTAFGGSIGARWLWGSEWRLTAGAELGWTRRVYSGLQQINDHVTPATDYRLGLANITADTLSLAVLGGLEWVFADTMSICLLPRLELLPGREQAVSVVLPLQVSFSFYL
jgi:hypothetical protein